MKKYFNVFAIIIITAFFISVSYSAMNVVSLKDGSGTKQVTNNINAFVYGMSEVVNNTSDKNKQVNTSKSTEVANASLKTCKHPSKESVYVDVGNAKTHEVWLACKNCKARITRLSAAANHIFGSWLPDNAPGRSYRKCSKCQYKEITYATLPKKNDSVKSGTSGTSGGSSGGKTNTDNYMYEIHPASGKEYAVGETFSVYIIKNGKGQVAAEKIKVSYASKYLQLTRKSTSCQFRVLDKPETGATSITVTYNDNGVMYTKTITIKIKRLDSQETPIQTLKPTSTLCPHTAKESVYVDVGNSKSHEVWIACKICKQRITRQSAASNHVFEYQKSETQHWKKCRLCTYEDPVKINHSFRNRTCSICKYDCKHTSKGSVYVNTGNRNSHEVWLACMNCKVRFTRQSAASKHNFVGGTCTYCEYKCPHSSRESVYVDVGNRYSHEVWLACKNCKVKITRQAAASKHNFKNKLCVFCGYECKHEDFGFVYYKADDNANYLEFMPSESKAEITQGNLREYHLKIKKCNACKTELIEEEGTIEKHSFIPNEKEQLIHTCAYCPASHDLRESKMFSEPTEPKPANCMHGAITYKICNVCGIDFDEKDDGKVDKNKHVILEEDIKEKVPSGFMLGESAGNTFIFGKHRITGNCSVCPEKNVTIEESCEDYIVAEKYYNGDYASDEIKKGSGGFYYYTTNDEKSPKFGHFTILMCSKCSGPGRRNKVVNHNSEKVAGTNITFLNYSRLTTDEAKSKHKATCSACSWSGNLDHPTETAGISTIKMDSTLTNLRLDGEYYYLDHIVNQTDINEHKPSKVKIGYHSRPSICRQCSSFFFDDSGKCSDSFGDGFIYKYQEIKVKQGFRTGSFVEEKGASHDCIKQCGNCRLYYRVKGMCDGTVNDYPSDNPARSVEEDHTFIVSCKICGDHGFKVHYFHRYTNRITTAEAETKISDGKWPEKIYKVSGALPKDSDTLGLIEVSSFY